MWTVQSRSKPPAKDKIDLGSLHENKSPAAAASANPAPSYTLTPPAAQVCSGAEKPPRWRSPLPVTQFYSSSNMAVGAGSDSEVS